MIREDADYTGVRVKVAARLASAHVALHVDVNFGDPIWPAPTDTMLPLLLGGELQLQGYPDHMVLAEKIVTAIERGDQNTRWRDFTDIAAIAHARTINGEALQHAINAVALHRNIVVGPLAPLISDMPDLAQRKWTVWRRKQRLESSTPVTFGELLESCLALTEPVLDGRTEHLEWDPHALTWTTYGQRESGQ